MDNLAEYLYLAGHLPNNRLLDIHDQLNGYKQDDDYEKWAKYVHPDPTTFGREVFGFEPSEKQKQYGYDYVTPDQERIHQSVLKYKRTFVKSCNSGGKTWDAALIGHFFYNRGFRVLITASTKAQADAGVGAEVRVMRRRAPPGYGGHWPDVECHANYSELHEMLTFSVAIGTDEEIAGSAAGRHYKRMCFIIDEGNTVNRKLLEQADRICTGPNDVILVLANPTPPTAAIRDISQVVGLNGPLWNVLTIDGLNHPNVIHNDPDIFPGAITKEMIDDQLAKAGGNPKHFLYAPPCRGEWADSSSDGLIKESWILAAMERWENDDREDDYRGTAVAADIAGAGGDASSVWKMTRWRLDRPIIPQDFVNKATTRKEMPTLKPGPAWLRGREVDETEDMLKGVMHTTPDARVLAIDATGMGQGPVATMRRYAEKLPKWIKHANDSRKIQIQEEREPMIVGYNFGESPDAEPTKVKFKKRKDQLLWHLREALRLGQFDIPPKKVWASWGLPADVDIMEELLRCVWGIDASGHIVIADKRSAECADDQMRDRVKNMPTESPNELHGIAMALYAFERLTPQPKPLLSNLDLRRAEAERQAAKDRASYANRGKRKSPRLPWHGLARRPR